MTEAEIDREIAQLRDTLAEYHETATTAHLYELSRYLPDEIVERVSRLDSKAGQFAGFSGAILALLLSTHSTWRAQIGGSILLFALAVLALACLGIGGGYAFKAMRITKFDWISDRLIVFPPALLDFPDELIRYHILAIYRSVLSPQQVSQKKARWVIRGANFFLAGAALLALRLGGILAKPWATPVLSSFYNHLPGRNL